MSNDLIFNIGGNNDPLKRSKDESLQIIDQWVSEAQAKFDGLEFQNPFTDGGLPFDFSESIEIPLEFDDGPIQDLLDGAFEATAAFGGMGEAISVAAGRASLVVGAAIAIAEVTETVARDWSGYNDALETSKELTEEISRNVARIRDDEIGRLVDAGDRNTLKERFEDAFRSLTRLREAQQAAETQRENALPFVGRSSINNDRVFTSQLDDELATANENLAEGERRIEALRTGLDRLAKAEEAAEKQREQAAQKQAQRDAEALAAQKEREAAAQRKSNEDIIDRNELLRLQIDLESENAEVRRQAQQDIDRQAANRAGNTPEQADEFVRLNQARRDAREASAQRRQDEREQEQAQDLSLIHI